MHDELHQIVIIFALFPDFDGRNADAFFKNRTGVDGHRTDDFTADVGLVAKHRRKGDQTPIFEHGQEYEPVVRMAHRACAGIWVRQENHVAVFECSFEVIEEAADEAAKLANNHLAGMIRYQGECVALFANAGGHRGAHQRCIHFDAGITQRVFDDVERYRIDSDLVERGVVRLNDLGGHVVRLLKPD